MHMSICAYVHVRVLCSWATEHGAYRQYNAKRQRAVNNSGISVAAVDQILDQYRNATTETFDKHRWSTRPGSGVPPHRINSANAAEGGEENVMRTHYLVRSSTRWGEDAESDTDVPDIPDVPADAYSAGEHDDEEDLFGASSGDEEAGMGFLNEHAADDSQAAHHPASATPMSSPPPATADRSAAQTVTPDTPHPRTSAPASGAATPSQPTRSARPQQSSPVPTAAAPSAAQTARPGTPHTTSRTATPPAGAGTSSQKTTTSNPPEQRMGGSKGAEGKHRGSEAERHKTTAAARRKKQKQEEEEKAKAGACKLHMHTLAHASLSVCVCVSACVLQDWPNSC